MPERIAWSRLIPCTGCPTRRLGHCSFLAATYPLDDLFLPLASPPQKQVLSGFTEYGGRAVRTMLALISITKVRNYTPSRRSSSSKLLLFPTAACSELRS